MSALSVDDARKMSSAVLVRSSESKQVAVRAINLLHGRPHKPGELEEADPPPLSRKRRTYAEAHTAADARGPRPLQPASTRPGAIRGLVAATLAGEEERSVDPGRKLRERREDASGEGDAAKRAVLLPVGLHSPVGVDAPDADEARCAIDVSAFERDPLGGS